MADEEKSPEVDTHRPDDKRHVTVKDEPEVFTIRPDTLEVEKEETPKHLKPLENARDLSPEEIARIVQDTADLIRFCEDKVISQRIQSAKLGFMLLRIEESLREYENCAMLLNRFVVNGDQVTSGYFVDMCKNLPLFGDHVRNLGDKPDSRLKVHGIESPVEKSDLQQFVKDIQHNAFVGGKFIQTFMAINKNNYRFMKERKEIAENVGGQIDSWLKLKNAVTEHLDILRDRLYKTSTHLDFVKSGETKIRRGPDLDISSYYGDSFYAFNDSVNATFRDTLPPGNSSFRSTVGKYSLPSEKSNLGPTFQGRNTSTEISGFQLRDFSSLNQ